jgi:hypothetical protein
VDGKLLVSGWWGIARKINYTGDLCLAYSFALTCGFSTWAVRSLMRSEPLDGSFSRRSG